MKNDNAINDSGEYVSHDRRLDCLHSACTLSSAQFNRRLHTLFTKNTRLFVSGAHEAKVLHESITAAMRTRGREQRDRESFTFY